MIIPGVNECWYYHGIKQPKIFLVLDLPLSNSTYLSHVISAKEEDSQRPSCIVVSNAKLFATVAKNINGKTGQTTVPCAMH
jgi:hypothetical protein